jgi:hypothetical protein
LSEFILSSDFRLEGSLFLISLLSLVTSPNISTWFFGYQQFSLEYLRLQRSDSYVIFHEKSIGVHLISLGMTVNEL